MTPEQYRAAAKAISDYRWMLAAALSSTTIEQTKSSIKAMTDLSKLRDALEAEGMKHD